MPQFHYYGRNLQGDAVKGTLDRNDKSSVVDYLMQQKITPVSIQVSSPSLFSVDWADIKKTLSSKKVSDEQRIMFCRQMYTINKAGMPLTLGMKSLASSMTEGALRDAVLDMVARLQSGMSLSLAMRYHTRIFDGLFISMVQIGEDSGNLDAVFLQLAHYIERDVQTRKSIKAAMRYPSFVLVAMATAMIVINIYVIPAFSNMFSRFDAQLPIATRILIGLSNFFVNYWDLLLILLAISGTFLFYWIRTEAGKKTWDHRKLSIPIVGPLINKASLARYTRSFAVMLKAGVPLTEAIGLCARVIDNSYLASRIDTIKSGVERGDSLKRTHTRSGIFSPLILQMINVGESSGTVDSLLLDVAEYYDKEVEYDLKTLSAKIEPILIVVMALFVLILALGIFLPMWEMYSVQQ
ncbi:MAG: type II secretion system F family protein [Cellvibrionaceae bacterium]